MLWLVICVLCITNVTAKRIFFHVYKNKKKIVYRVDDGIVQA
jgi:hypothetical protein